MSEQSERAQRFGAFFNSQVGREILAMLDEQIKEPKDEFYRLVGGSKPELLVGKKGIQLASRARGLEDFRESILDEVRASENAK